MEETKTALQNRFYQEYWLFLILLLLGVVMLSVLLVGYIHKQKNMTAPLKQLVPIACVGMLVLLIILGNIFIPYAKDMSHVKNDDFLFVRGKVVGYDHATSNDVGISSTPNQSGDVQIIDFAFFTVYT